MDLLISATLTALGGLLKFLGVNLPAFVWVTDMIHCPMCNKKLPEHIEYCPECGAPVTKTIKEPEEHGFHYLVVNQVDIPNDC